MSESQSMTNSLPRDMEKSNASNAKTSRLGVAFDPSAGPAEAESSKVRQIMSMCARTLHHYFYKQKWAYWVALVCLLMNRFNVDVHTLYIYNVRVYLLLLFGSW